MAEVTDAFANEAFFAFVWKMNWSSAKTTWLTLYVRTVVLCVLQVITSVTVFAGSPCLCDAGFAYFYRFSDLLIRNASSCFVLRFHFDYGARNEPIEDSFLSNCFVFVLIPGTLLVSVCWLKMFWVLSLEVILLLLLSIELVLFLSRQPFLWSVECFMLSALFFKEHTSSSICQTEGLHCQFDWYWSYFGWQIRDSSFFPVFYC